MKKHPTYSDYQISKPKAIHLSGEIVKIIANIKGLKDIGVVIPTTSLFNLFV